MDAEAYVSQVYAEIDAEAYKTIKNHSAHAPSRKFSWVLMK